MLASTSTTSSTTTRGETLRFVAAYADGERVALLDFASLRCRLVLVIPSSACPKISRADGSTSTSRNQRFCVASCGKEEKHRVCGDGQGASAPERGLVGVPVHLVLLIEIFVDSAPSRHALLQFVVHSRRRNRWLLTLVQPLLRARQCEGHLSPRPLQHHSSPQSEVLHFRSVYAESAGAADEDAPVRNGLNSG